MYKECLKLFSRIFQYVSGLFKVRFKSVSKVLKGSFMGVSIVCVLIEVIAATRAYGVFVFILNHTNSYIHNINYFTGSKLSDSAKELLGLDSMDMIPQKLLKRVLSTLYKQLER